MWFLPSGLKVYLALGHTDMRKSVNGLSIIISDYLEADLFNGDLFVFCNRKKNILKILYWDRTGFCMFYKRLEKEKFQWPIQEGEKIEVSSRQLQWLLEGLELSQKRAHEPLNYQLIY